MGAGLTLVTTTITVVGTVIGAVFAALVAACFQYGCRRRKGKGREIPDESQNAITSEGNLTGTDNPVDTSSELPPVNIGRTTSQLPPVDIEGKASHLTQVETTLHLMETTSQLPAPDIVGRAQLISMGPWGHPQEENRFHHEGFDGIKTIKIFSSSVVDSIEIQYTKDGKLYTHKEGGKGGFAKPEVFLEDGEYINEVIGYYGSFHQIKTINSLTFFTNKFKKFGPYGKSLEENHELETTRFTVKGGKIVGVYGNARKYITAIGFYVLIPMDLSTVSNRHANMEMKDAIGRPQLITIGPWGHSNVGNCFHHDCFDGIKTITVYSASVIDSIEIQYIKDEKPLTWTLKEGGHGGHAQPKVIFGDGEYINEVIGYYGSYQGRKTINSLTFITNRFNMFGPYGKSTQDDDELETTRFCVRGGRLVGFHGNAQRYLTSLGFYILPIELPMISTRNNKTDAMVAIDRPKLIYMEPWGDPKDEDHFDHPDYNYIKTIKIYSGSVIDSIELQYMKDGKFFTLKEGGHGGVAGRQEILEDGEYINEVTGCYGSYQGTKTINSLTFFTNRSKKFGPYGKSLEEKRQLETTRFHVKGGKIVGFYGNAHEYITAIGFYVLPVDFSLASNLCQNGNEVQEAFGRSRLITIGPWGHPKGGNYFHHDCFDNIKTIKIYSGSVIDSIEIQYIKNEKPLTWTLKEGGYGGHAQPEIVLRDGEYINEVFGYYGSYNGKKTINSLLFITNKSNTFGPYGKSIEEDGEIETTCFHVRGGRIVGFHGNARRYISAIGFYVLP